MLSPGSLCTQVFDTIVIVAHPWIPFRPGHHSTSTRVGK